MNDEVDKLAKVIWDYCKMRQDLVKSDAIIALGSMDLRIAEKAAELWHRNLAPVIVTSGGFGRLTGSNWTETEAKKFAEVLYSKGISKDKVLIEDNSTNTAENIRLSIDLLKLNSIQPKRLIIISQPYMERRAYVTFLKLFPNIEVFVTSPDVSYELYPTKEITKEDVLNIMVGDIQRIKLYPSKGFTIPQVIPNEVELAMNKLIKLGYYKQLIK